MTKRIVLLLAAILVTAFVFAYGRSGNQQARLVVAEIKGRVGTDVQLTARLLDATTGQPIAGKPVSFGCITTPATRVVTDAFGFARYVMNLNEGTRCGIYDITASFAGDDAYLSSWGTAKLTVLKGPSYLWVGDRSSRPGVPAPLIARLTNGSDKPIEGALIRFKLAGHPIGTAKTGSNGFAYFTAQGRAVPGDYGVSVSFAGDEGHEGSAAKGTLRVK